MVYLTEWTDFQNQCIQLYQRAPDRTRYLIKATPSTHQLTLKVTDDHTTLKFRTRSAVILGRFEQFNKAMASAMAGEPHPLAQVAPSTAEGALGSVASTATTTTTTAAVGGQSGATGSSGAAATTKGGAAGSKKKKKGKK